MRHQFYLGGIMKKVFLLLIVLMVWSTGSSQSCLPQGISFSTQAQIDNFHSNYPNCTQIEGDVQIIGADIANLNRLNVLTSIGGTLQINYTDSLKALSGLNNVTSIGGHLMIVSNNALTSLTGLEGVTSIVGSLWIQANNALTSLTGLNNVTSVGGELFMGYNTIITNLTGLEGLKSLGGQLGINSNNALTSLTGLEELKSIGGNLGIQSNATLASLTGLEGLDSISGYIWIKNNLTLTTLTGLDYIDAGTITELHIFSNPILSECAIQSICDYLAKTYGYFYIEIHDNATGCNSQAEVDTACNHLSVENLPFNDIFSLYPNPSSDQVNIVTSAVPAKGQLSILNTSGQQLIISQITEPKTVIDISTLPSGVYFVRVTNDKTVEVGKIIKQ